MLRSDGRFCPLPLRPHNLVRKAVVPFFIPSRLPPVRRCPSTCTPSPYPFPATAVRRRPSAGAAVGLLLRHADVAPTPTPVVCREKRLVQRLVLVDHAKPGAGAGRSTRFLGLANAVFLSCKKQEDSFISYPTDDEKSPGFPFHQQRENDKKRSWIERPPKTAVLGARHPSLFPSNDKHTFYA